MAAYLTCAASHAEPRYYTTVQMDASHSDACSALLAARSSTTSPMRRMLLAITGTLCVAVLCFSAGYSDAAVRLHRWTTFELEASKGSNVAQGILEVGEYSKRWHLQLIGKAFPGVWKTGLSRETGQPITQHAEVTIKEGIAAVRLGLTKTAGSLVNMALKSSVETSNEYTYGGAMGGRFQPVIFAGNIGTREGDTSMNAGFVTDGQQYKLRAGAEGKHEDHKWKLEVQSGTRHRPIIWKASVATDKNIDLQRSYRPDVGVSKDVQKKTTKARRGRSYNTYTYMGEEESFPPEY